MCIIIISQMSHWIMYICIYILYIYTYVLVCTHMQISRSYLPEFRSLARIGIPAGLCRSIPPWAWDLCRICMGTLSQTPRGSGQDLSIGVVIPTDEVYEVICFSCFRKVETTSRNTYIVYTCNQIDISHSITVYIDTWCIIDAHSVYVHLHVYTSQHHNDLKRPWPLHQLWESPSWSLSLPTHITISVTLIAHRDQQW